MTNIRNSMQWRNIKPATYINLTFFDVWKHFGDNGRSFYCIVTLNWFFLQSPPLTYVGRVYLNINISGIDFPIPGNNNQRMIIKTSHRIRIQKITLKIVQSENLQVLQISKEKQQIIDCFFKRFCCLFEDKHLKFVFY